jgi:cytochrome o ubiquinol oxidase subunit 2
MRFTFHGLSPQDFDAWVGKVRAAGGDLSLAAYDKLREPSRAAPVHYYAKYDADLYDRILNMCVLPGEICKSQLMAADAHGGKAMQDMHAHATTRMADAPKQAAPAADAH